ncbi:MAG: IS605 OrfB-like transposable element containing RNAse H-like and Zn finger domain [Candidatus Methanohalarchaeum thermophilum]|uniref:IS605 OrfB-like transposable element containing RNAse H-like and Zn finger domain n=1 Tax=Methanohalarchaeum thermophilum TaxID=1903181 RepID=A0A1Q6DUA8_METT1|nr:MAG: IS605 OrfB-like transposable element containing RNAse H-like and Zn finger domain [Candidatus Methanohalarchaeum thermophilum]
MWCWKVLLQLELPKPDKQSIMEDSVVVGMDLNVSNFLVDSEGREIQNLKTMLARKYEGVEKGQKKLSRKVGGK